MAVHPDEIFFAVIFAAPPEVKQTSGPRLVVPVGQDEVKLQCTVKNAQDYTWYKNGAQFSAPLPPRYTIKAYRFLEITNAVKSDSGLFFCVTSNNVGSTNCSVELLVEGMDISLLDSIIVPCIALYWSAYTCHFLSDSISRSSSQWK